MQILGKLKNFLSEKAEPVELEQPDQADDVFKDRRREKLEELEDKTQNFDREVETRLENLERDLQNLRGYEDPKNRAIIEDNIENFIQKRLDLINDFSTSQNLEELHGRLEQFLKEFNSMTEKRGKILEEAGVGDSVFNTLNDLNGVFEDIQNFMDSDYTTRRHLEELEAKTARLKELNTEIKSVRQKIEDKQVEKVKEQLEEKKSEINRLKGSSLKNEFEEMQEELEQAREDRRKLLEDTGKNIGRMERGLKKMLHESKIGKVSEEGSRALRDIRDGNKKELIDRDPAKVEEAVKAVEKSVEGDFLSGSTRQQLIQGVSFFSTFRDKKMKLKKLQSEIKELEKNVENHSFKSDLQKLEKEKEELENKLQKQKREKSDLRNRKDSLESEIAGLQDEIVSILEKEFDTEIEKTF